MFHNHFFLHLSFNYQMPKGAEQVALAHRVVSIKREAWLTKD